MNSKKKKKKDINNFIFKLNKYFFFNKKDLEPPTINNKVKIKVIEEIGSVLTKDGRENNFMKNTEHFLPR
jgi:hypothetical protein